MRVHRHKLVVLLKECECPRRHVQFMVQTQLHGREEGELRRLGEAQEVERVKQEARLDRSETAKKKREF